jgi:hypothetical protein
MTGSKGNYLQGTGYSGYAFAFQDSKTSTCGLPGGKACGTSTGCLAFGEFCGSGMTGIKNGGITYGAGIGVSFAGMGEAGAMPVTITGTGLTYAISATPSTGPMFGMEITINNGAYCTKTTQLSGTIPWSSFTSHCTSATDAGAPFTGTTLSGVIFRANAGLTAAPYDFCVTQLGF